MNNELFKADPNRLFRKGDIVEMDTHGRDVAASLKKAGIELGKRYTVTEGESNTGHNTGYVSFIGDDGIEHRAMFFWLKLLTPIEEAEPFYIERNDMDGCYYVKKDDNKTPSAYRLVQAFFFKTKQYTAHYYTEGQAEELANETCKRLNDEWRKEHNHA